MFESTHKLPFEVSEWYDPDYSLFRIGTCGGLWMATSESYIIVAIDNNTPHNGHLNDVFEWFENSCKRDNKTLKVVELLNPNFMMHLIQKRGFKKIEGNNVEKTF